MTKNELLINVRIMKRFIFLLSLTIFFVSKSIAITLPAPPPELPETLTDFRTKEQVEEDSVVEGKLRNDNFDDINAVAAPFVSGDEQLGILRFTMNYQADTKIGVPAYGLTVLRFYSSEGVPLEITDVKLESPGFVADVTASASELVIKQKAGCSNTSMVVNIAQSSNPLVFNLSSVYLKNKSTPVNTILTALKVKTYVQDNEYVIPKTVEIPISNPLASDVNVNTQSFVELEEQMLKALDEIRYDDN